MSFRGPSLDHARLFVSLVSDVACRKPRVSPFRFDEVGWGAGLGAPKAFPSAPLPRRGVARIESRAGSGAVGEDMKKTRFEPTISPLAYIGATCVRFDASYPHTYVRTVARTLPTESETAGTCIPDGWLYAGPTCPQTGTRTRSDSRLRR